MANTIYENSVLASQIADISNTSLDVFPLMTVDTDLVETAGMKKIINLYKYTGESETLEQGEGNTGTGAVSFTKKEYEVELSQQRFIYHDEEVMTDSKVVEVGVKGLATSMSNEIKAKYFTEVVKTTNEVEYTGSLNYDAVVDAIGELNIEDEEGLFLLISPSFKKELRKDADFKAAEQGKVIATGHIGSISGIPVIVSKLVTVPIVADKKAVTCFVKVNDEAAQERDENTRKNTIYGRKVNLVALTDETKACKLTKKTT